MAVKSTAILTTITVACCLPLPSQAQDLYTFTENLGGGNIIALGYPPPEPVNSTQPVDGFRSYQSLHTRHQDLMLQHDFIRGKVVGQTIAGRDIWAYVLGDANHTTLNAGPESSALVNGGIHAREWASPELTTGLIEAWANNAGDRHIYDYLIDNVHFTVLPVNNVDGFLQTQRYPTEVLIGQDPTVFNWPRDGRMRRKNMRGADEFLFTEDDHLLGIDLNRNNSPFWAATSSSSSDPTSLVYHGTAAFSEPETQALLAAAELALANRLRWYQDSHSFSQVFFSVRTFNQRRNQIQAQLLRSYSDFYNALSIQRNGQSRRYSDRPNNMGQGIGVTAGHFAYTYEIPSWTLEIEPRNGGEDYGGFGANHDGFILPESEVSRMRNDMATTHAVVAYRQAGPPSIVALSIYDSGGLEVYSSQWDYADNRSRTLVVNQIEPLLPGLEYQLIVTFDKPMRWVDNDNPAPAPGHVSISLAPQIDVARPDNAGTVLSIDTENGQWLANAYDVSSHSRYRYDSFAVMFTLGSNLNLSVTDALNFSISAEDFTTQSLDANPASVADWTSGSWSGYENSQGITGDTGGADQTLPVRIASSDSIRRWLLRRR